MDDNQESMLPEVKLRAVEPEDADFLYEIENDAEAWRYGDTVAPLSRRILREYALNYDADPFSARQIRFIITEFPSGCPVGVADLYEISPRDSRAFVGIYICPDERRVGFGLAALAALARYSRETLHLHQLNARIEKGNDPSERLFGDAGYKCVAVLPDWIGLPDGKFADMGIWQSLFF